MQITKISVVSHLRMLLLIFDSKDPLGALSFKIQTLFLIALQNQTKVLFVLLNYLSFVLASHLTLKFNQLDTELNIGEGWQYKTKNEVNMLQIIKTGKLKNRPCHIAIRKAKAGSNKFDITR